MSIVEIKEFPNWVLEHKGSDLGRAKARYLLNTIAAYATQSGSVAALAELLGYNRTSISAMLVSGALDNGLPVPMIKRIEELLGDKVVIPRSIMNEFIYG